MEQRGDLITLAIFVSRVDAVIVASMLRGYGVHVDLNADSYGAIDPISLALGGYRLRVFEEDYQVSSDILREAGTAEQGVVSTGPRKAIIRFALAWIGVTLPFSAMALVASDFRVSEPLLVTPIELIIPVNPQGKADYFLAPAVGG